MGDLSRHSGNLSYVTHLSVCIDGAECQLITYQEGTPCYLTGNSKNIYFSEPPMGT